jgi:cyclohexanone monooxygenase
VDCIVFASGFEVGTSFTRRAGYEVTGRNGLTLTEKWSEGVRTLHGVHVHGFPNLMIMGNSQSAATTNFPHAMDEAARHMTYILTRCSEEGLLTIEATREAEDAWVEEIISVSRYSEAFQASCTPGYYNNEGQPSSRAIQNGSYGKGPNPYFRRIKAWREEGDLAGLTRRTEA